MTQTARDRSRHRRCAIRWSTTLTALAVVAPASAALASGGSATGSDVQIGGSSSTGSPNPGAVFTYTFLVKNSGPDTATSVSVTDPLPAGTVYNYATATGSTLPCAAIGQLSGGASVSCSLGDIPKGGQGTVVVAVNAPLTTGSFTNTATMSSTSADPSLSNNSASVTVQVKASNKNGVNDTAGWTTAAPCAAVGNLSAPVGYYSTWAAIWNTFTVRSCSTSSESINVEVTDTNTATGSVDHDVVLPMTLAAAQNQSMVLDNDMAALSTTYLMTVTATDLSGNVLATASLLATTPPPQ